MSNKIFEDLVYQGVTAMTPEDEAATEQVLASHINPILDELKTVENAIDVNAGRTGWFDDEVQTEMDWLYGKVHKILQDLEKLF